MMKFISNDEVDKFKLNNGEFNIFWYSLVNDEVPSTTSQIVKLIEDIQGGDIPGVSKMNDSALDKK